MSTTLRDFIAQRETEIRDQQRALKLELRELQLAKAALETQTTASNSTVGAASSLTIKEMARQVLSAELTGLSANSVLDGIKRQFGRDIERTSLSPQLSRLKDDGELHLHDDIWFTTENWNTYSARLTPDDPDAFTHEVSFGDLDDPEVPF